MWALLGFILKNAYASWVPSTPLSIYTPSFINLEYIRKLSEYRKTEVCMLILGVVKGNAFRTFSQEATETFSEMPCKPKTKECKMFLSLFLDKEKDTVIVTLKKI